MVKILLSGLFVVGVGALVFVAFNSGAVPASGKADSFTNEDGVTISVDKTPVLDALDIVGQGYIEQPDGTITIYLK